MNKRYVQGFIMIMLLGVVSESYSSYYDRYVSPYLPGRQTVQRYIPWGIGGALGGSLGSYGAGRYMGYDPRLAAGIGLLLGGSLGIYGKKLYESFLEARATQIVEETRKRKEKEAEKAEKQRQAYIEEFDLKNIFNLANFSSDYGHTTFKWFGEQNNSDKNKLAEFLREKKLIKIGKEESGTLYYDFDSEAFERRWRSSFNNAKFTFIREILDIMDAFEGKFRSFPGQHDLLSDRLLVSDGHRHKKEYEEEGRSILKEYFGTPEVHKGGGDKGKEKE